MAILMECPICHKKQGVKNKLCNCGEDLVKLKKANRVKYWISYRLPGGKQRRELIGSSIEEARDADGKRRGQKRENRVFEILPEANMTLQELTDWYLGLKKIQSLRSYSTIKFLLSNFNREFGSKIVSRIKPEDLENYQVKRKEEGKSEKTIDSEIQVAKAVINKAFENDKVDGKTLKVFKRVKKLLKKNANARKKILTIDQFRGLMAELPIHAQWIVGTGFFTGMRLREILSLKWNQVSLRDRIIRLEAENTKDKEPRIIPICDELYSILDRIPRSLHSDYVFLYKGKPINDIRNCLSKACRRASIVYGRNNKDGVVFHDLRHSFNTYMRKAGIPESVIMDITGHSTREMFDRYNSVDHEDRVQAIRRFEGFLKGRLESVDQNVDQTAILGSM